jgi:origin recognition complex subunit 1
VNALRLPSPKHVYTTLWEALTGTHASPKRAAELLERHFTSKSKQPRPVTVLLVDELDLLVTRTQTVLYNLIDW